jgi:hypothetical protein
MLIQPAADGAIYWQTRVYKDSEQGWVRAKVTRELWGKARQLESDYFVFHYRTVDEKAVTQAAARLDALFPLLYSSFFADRPTGEKQVIVIDPEWKLGDLSKQTTPSSTLIVASPAATLRPADLAAGDLLLQSAMLALFERLAEQATAQYNLSPEAQVVYSGLRLWLIWEHDLPLAQWREPLVRWAFRDPQVASGPTAFAVPIFAHDLCLEHTLWMRSPLDIRVPVLCWHSPAGEERITAWRYQSVPIKLPLTSLVYRPANIEDISKKSDETPPEPVGSGIGLATVFEYMALNGDPQHISRLLAALPQHKSTETLIPAVFALSKADFQRGWQAFVANRYGIAP